MNLPTDPSKTIHGLDKKGQPFFFFFLVGFGFWLEPGFGTCSALSAKCWKAYWV
jgi:hypothetical protein